MNILPQLAPTPDRDRMPRMSSREIASLCDKRHSHVKRDIDVICADLEIDASRFGHIYLDSRNRSQTEYLLGKDLTLTLISGYNVILRKRIVDRWLELEEAARNRPATIDLRDPVQLARVTQQLAEINRDQAREIEAMREDVESLDRIRNADGSFCITDAAKALQMRPKELFDWLQGNGWIYKRPGAAGYLGYQSRTAASLLEHKVTTVLRADGSEKVTEQVRVTAKGLTKLAALIRPRLR